jgi:enoyl-CoA hydratase
MTVKVVREGAVTTVTLDRQDCRNAVDPPTARRLYDAFVEFERDPDALVAVLHGAGGHFCAGFDLKALAAGGPDWLHQLHFGQGSDAPPLGPMGPTRLLLRKPVIAAVSGAAVAGGMELALWCDYRILETTAYMGVYCRRWGVPLIDGGTVRLPRLVGLGRARELVLRGRRVDAEECLRIGLCEFVVPAGEALATAEAHARDIARFPQHCLRADRRGLENHQGLPTLEALRAEFQWSVPVLQTEGLGGAGRFAEGRGRHGDFEDL